MVNKYVNAVMGCGKLLRLHDTRQSVRIPYHLQRPVSPPSKPAGRIFAINRPMVKDLPMEVAGAWGDSLFFPS